MGFNVIFFYLVRNRVKLALLEFLPEDQAILLLRGKRLLSSLDVIPFTIRNTIEMVEQLYGIVHGYFDIIGIENIVSFFDLLKKNKEENAFEFPIVFNSMIQPSNAFLAAFKESSIRSLGSIYSEYLNYIVTNYGVLTEEERYFLKMKRNIYF